MGENGDALLQLPEWAAPRQSLTWAPSVLHRDGEFILYYVTRYVTGGRQCISYAVSDTLEGPFADPNDEPFICQLDEGGSIDPEPVIVQDGTTHPLWKSDGNCAPNRKYTVDLHCVTGYATISTKAKGPRDSAKVRGVAEAVGAATIADIVAQRLPNCQGVVGFLVGRSAREV